MMSTSLGRRPAGSPYLILAGMVSCHQFAAQGNDEAIEPLSGVLLHKQSQQPRGKPIIHVPEKALISVNGVPRTLSRPWKPKLDMAPIRNVTSNGWLTLDRHNGCQLKRRNNKTCHPCKRGLCCETEITTAQSHNQGGRSWKSVSHLLGLMFIKTPLM